MEKDKRYNFISVNDGVLNQAFNNVKVTSGPISYKLASSILNVATRHSLLWPYIPDKASFSKDPTKQDYFTIEFPSGVESVMCMAWILPDSIVEVQGIEKTITVSLDNQTQYEELLALLKVNGINYRVN